MKQYHISYFEKEGDFFSKGENFESHGPTWAVTQFANKYPDAIFISCVSLDCIKSNYGTLQAVQHTD